MTLVHFGVNHWDSGTLSTGCKQILNPEAKKPYPPSGHLLHHTAPELNGILFRFVKKVMRFSELEQLQPRNPYIWRESFNTCPTSCSARMRRCSALPYLNPGPKRLGSHKCRCVATARYVYSLLFFMIVFTYPPGN